MPAITVPKRRCRFSSTTPDNRRNLEGYRANDGQDSSRVHDSSRRQRGGIRKGKRRLRQGISVHAYLHAHRDYSPGAILARHGDDRLNSTAWNSRRRTHAHLASRPVWIQLNLRTNRFGRNPHAQHAHPDRSNQDQQEGRPRRFPCSSRSHCATISASDADSAGCDTRIHTYDLLGVLGITRLHPHRRNISRTVLTLVFLLALYTAWFRVKGTPRKETPA